MSPSEPRCQSAEDTSQPEYRVRLVGWRVGFQKVTATQLIRVHTDLDLVAAKRCVDDCLTGTGRILIPKSERDARTLAVELHRCGAVVTLE